MEPITKKGIQSYLIEKKIFDTHARFKIVNILEETDTAEGYVNLIYQVIDENTGKSVVVKQVMPYILSMAKLSGIEHDVCMDRMQAETRILVFLDHLYSGITPEIYLIDEPNGLIVMEDLCHLNLLRFELADGHPFPDIGKKLGAFLAGLYFFTSDLSLSPAKKKKLQLYFKNDEAKRLDDLIFGQCVLFSKERPLEPEAEPTRDRTLADSKLRECIAALRHCYLTEDACLMHNDLHTSNIMADAHNLKIIDTEFSGYGSSWMDIGRLASSFLINYVSWLGMPDIPVEKRSILQEEALSLLCDLFNSFRIMLLKLQSKYADTIPGLSQKDMTIIYDDLFKKSLQCATICTIMRCTSDFARSCEIKRITDSHLLGLLQKRVLEIAEYTLLMTDTFNSIEDFCDFIRCCAAVSNQ